MATIYVINSLTDPGNRIKYRSGAWPDAGNGTDNSNLTTALGQCGLAGTLIISSGTYSGAQLYGNGTNGFYITAVGMIGSTIRAATASDGGGHEGLVIIDGTGLGDDTTDITQVVTVNNLIFQNGPATKFNANITAAATFNNCTFKDSTYRNVAVNANAIFNKCIFKNALGSNFNLQIAGANTQPIFNWCQFLDTTGINIYFSATDISKLSTFNNCIILGDGQVLTTSYAIFSDAGAGKASAVFNNCIIGQSGIAYPNSGYTINNRGTDNTYTFNNCCILPNSWEPDRLYATTAPTFNNCIYDNPLFRTPKYPAVIVICMDDTGNLGNFSTLAGLLEARGMRGVLAAYPGVATSGNYNDMAVLARAGHEIAAHSYNHVHTASLDAVTITYSNGAETATAAVAAGVLTLNSTLAGDGDDHALTLSTYANITALVAAVEALDHYGCTNTNSKNANADPEDLADVGATAIGAGLALELDQERFFTREIDGAKTELESQIQSRYAAYSCETFMPAYNSTSQAVQERCKTATYLGASAGLPGDVPGDYLFSSINIYKIFRIAAGTYFNKVGAGDVLTEAQMTSRTGAFCELLRNVGGVAVIYNHAFANDGELSQNEITWMLNSIQDSGIPVMTFAQAVQYIIDNGTIVNAAGAYPDNMTYTRTLVNAQDAINDYGLRADSPCRNTGLNTVWATQASITDRLGTSITNAAGTVIAPGGTVDMGTDEWIGGGGGLSPSLGLSGGNRPPWWRRRRR